MILAVAFMLGFGLLGFEILQFRAMDTFIDQAFVLMIPLFLFGTAAGHALGSWVPAARGRVIARGAAMFFLLLITVNLAFYAVAGSWWPTLLCGLITSLSATLAWGLSAVLLFPEARPLRVNAALAFGGLAAAFLVPALDAFGYSAVTKIFVAIVAAGLLGAEYFPRAAEKAPEKRSRAILIVAAAVFLFACVFKFATPDPRPDSPALSVYSNSYANIKVAPMVHAFPHGPGTVKGEPSAVTDREERLRVFSVFRNRLEATLIFDAKEKADLDILKQETAHGLYGLGNRGSLAVVGSGGGAEILHGQIHGFKKITAVEINPLMVQASRDFSRNAFGYGAANVETHISEARLFFRRLPADERYDVIALTSARNYGRLGVSVFAENYLLTREALRDYIRHLNVDGLLLIRITQGFRIFGSLRVSLSQAASEGEIYQIALPQKQSVNFRSAKEQVLLYKKGKFTPEQLRMLEQISEKVLPLPIQVRGRGAPVITDDRPYGTFQAAADLSGFIPGVVPVCLFLLQVMFVLILLVVQRRRVPGAAEMPLVYSFFSGWAFAATQGLLLDKVTFLTGRPAFSLTAVLMGFFVAAGLMSILVERSGLRFTQRRLTAAALLTGAAFGLSQIAVLWFGRSAFPDFTLSLVALAAIFVTAGVSAWTFAYFFKYFSGEPGRVPFLLCANGLGSLLAGIQSKYFAVEFGFSAALVAVLGVYALMSALPVLRSAREA